VPDAGRWFDTGAAEADNGVVRQEAGAMGPMLTRVLSELRQGLERLYGERLAGLVLYGSQARGDAGEGSDIDVLIVLKGVVSVCEEIARATDLVAETSLRHDVVIVPTFVTDEQYRRARTPLLLNVRREGVPV
jgi:predicted nucleotidyltransferase